MTIIRPGTVHDLPQIINLIKESYQALSDHYGDSRHQDCWNKGVVDAVAEDLNESSFLSTYFNISSNHFWVAESIEGIVIGCVGLKRKNSDECELVRMAVAQNKRGSGIGGLLINTLLLHCKEQRLCRILLTTANPLSAKFYGKKAFKIAKHFRHSLELSNLPVLDMEVWSMVYYVGAKIIRKVGLVGGTHGNELLGIELVKRWRLNQQHHHQQDEENEGSSNTDELRRSTLRCLPVLSNLPAIAVNRRYVDKDLNRQFKLDNLTDIMHSVSGEGAATNATIESENFSAARLNELLGPKTEFYSCPTGVDFIVDMHSSTSSLGNMLILGCLMHDNLAAHTALAVTQRLNQQDNGDTGGSSVLHNGMLRVASIDITKPASHWVDSIAPSGLAIEVGALAHGTMNASLLEDTRAIVLAIVNFLEQRNLSILQEAQQMAAAVLQAGAGACDPQLLQDAQNFDFDTCQYVPSSLCPTSVLPAAVRTTTGELAQAELPYFFMLNPLLFPTAATQQKETRAAEVAVTKAEEASFASLSAALQSRLRRSWENVSAAPAKEAILHASMDQRDWVPFVEGAPLFQSLHGSRSVIPFQRTEHAPSEGKSCAALYPVFINEAAYQESNMACWVTKDSKFTLY